MIEQPIPGIDDLEDVSPHCQRIDYISIDMTPAEARTVRQILAVYNDDDDEHMAHVSNVLRRLRFALGEKV